MPFLPLLRRRGGVGPCYLDDYTTDMLAAYGTRQIVSTYTGPLIKVRRDSDDAELDINAKSDGSLDTSALRAHVGSGNGYVTTRYDQIGSNDEAQAIDAQQPIIVTSGMVETVGNSSRPAALFSEGTTANLISEDGMVQPLTALNVAEPGDALHVQYAMGSETFRQCNVFAYGGFRDNSWTIDAAAPFLYGSTFNPGELSSVWAVFNDGGTSVLSANGDVETGVTGTHNPDGLRTGNYSTPSTDYVFRGHHAERVMWSGDKGVYRSAVERLIGLYYGIDVDHGNLELQVSFNDYTPANGESVVLSIRVENTTGFAATDAAILALVPSGLSYTSSNPSTGSYNSTSGVWSIDALAAGASETITVTCSVTGSTGDEIEWIVVSSGVVETIGSAPDSVTCRLFVGLLGTRATAHQSGGDVVPVGGLPLGEWDTTSASQEGPATFIFPGTSARQDCAVDSIRINVDTVGTGSWKFKVFRWSGATYTYIGERNIAITGTGAQLVSLSSPIDVQMADTFGVFAPSAAKIAASASFNSKLPRYASGADVTSDNAFASVSGGRSYEVEIYGNRPYLAISGDSIASGANNTPDTWEGWLEDGSFTTVPGGTDTSEIWNQIRADFSAVEYQNSAYGGSQFDFIVDTGLSYMLAVDPHTIILFCGTNDVYWLRSWKGVRDDLDCIKAQADASGVRRIALCEIIPRSAYTDAQAERSRVWNTNYDKWCKCNGAQLITCHDAMGEERVATGELDDLAAAYDVGDGIHLSTAGVEALSELIQDQL